MIFSHNNHPPSDKKRKGCRKGGIRKRGNVLGKNSPAGSAKYFVEEIEKGKPRKRKGGWPKGRESHAGNEKGEGRLPT